MNKTYNEATAETNMKSWEEARIDAIASIRKREDDIMRNWISELGYKDAIGYFFNYSDKTLEIYATRPGVLIGKAGVNINKLRDVLKEEFVKEWSIKFVEIRGSMIIPKKEDEWTLTTDSMPTEKGSYLVTKDNKVMAIDYVPGSWFNKLAWRNVTAWKKNVKPYTKK